MTQDTDREETLLLHRSSRCRFRRLVDHTYSVAQPRRQRRTALGLQDDQAIRQLKGLLCPLAGVDIAIEVGPGQGHNQRSGRIKAAIIDNRLVAAPRMQGDAQIARRAVILLADRQLMPETPEDAGPADRRHAVALARVWRGRTTPEKPHEAVICRGSNPKSEIRNPKPDGCCC